MKQVPILFAAILLVATAGCLSFGGPNLSSHAEGYAAFQLEREFLDSVDRHYKKGRSTLDQEQLEFLKENALDGQISDAQMRKIVGIINSESSSDDVAQARETSEKVNKELTDLVRSLGHQIEDLQGEVNKLKGN